jgi:hypothetical protein
LPHRLGFVTSFWVEWWHIAWYLKKKHKYWDGDTLNWLGPTMVTVQNSWCGVWECDKTMEPVKIK